ATDAMYDIVKARYETFGTAGNASKMGKVISLEDMVARYDSGELAQQIK
ncbi:MAG: fructose-bisphosphate aldolase class II, partial [Phenylobacterium sp.]